MTTTPRADQLKALRALRTIGVVGSERWPTPQDVIAGSKEAQANILHRARSDLVRKYRANPTSWPDGIHGKSDPWYKPEEWDDQGKWIAPYKPPWLAAVAKARDVVQEAPTETSKPSVAEIAAAKKPETVSLTSSLTSLTSSLTAKPPLDSNKTPESNESNTPFDKKAYQRDYMRQRRAALKTTTTLTQPSSVA